jgi:hypothetical protein
MIGAMDLTPNGSTNVRWDIINNDVLHCRMNCMLVCHAKCDILVRFLLTFGMNRLGHFTTFTFCAGAFCRFFVKAGGKDLICAASTNSSFTMILMTILGCPPDLKQDGGGGDHRSLWAHSGL